MANRNNRNAVWIQHPTPPFEDDFKILKPMDDEKVNILTYGYVRLFEEKQSIFIIADGIKQLILLFYHTKYIMHGRDCFGIIYQCKQIKTNKTYAVKIIHKNKFYRIPNRFVIRAMLDELDILSTLNHPHIIRIENVYNDKHKIYIVMEECVGGKLFDRIVEKEQFSEQDAANIIKQLLTALKYMYEENALVHCDVTPDNIFFVDKSDTSLTVKIMGFGMSKVLPRLKHLTHLYPAPYYVTPEAIEHNKYNHPSDIWSIGVILYIMIFGYPPFYVDPEKYGKSEENALYEKIKRGFIGQVRETEKYGFGPWFPDHIKVSKEAKHLITKLLEKNTRDRYSANEALSHPWIVNEGKFKNEQYDQIESLRTFNNIYQFKLCIMNIFHEHFDILKPKHFQKMKELFVKINIAHDGILSHFKKMKEIFIKMNIAHDGIVSYQEFMNVVLNINDINISKRYMQQLIFGNANKETGINFVDLLDATIHDYLVECDMRLYDRFRELDDNNNGKIDVQQLKDTLKEFDNLDEWEKAMQIINHQTLDSNGSSDIDYEEFLFTLHPNFEENARF